MGSRFLSPTLRVCVYLKKTNTSFNWVVLVFKITQGGGGGGVRAHRPRSLLALLLRPSGVARATGRGPDPSRGGTPVPVDKSGRPRQATPYSGERGWETWLTSSSLSLENSFCLEKRFCLTPFLASEALKGDRNRGPPRGFSRPLRRLQGPGHCSLGCAGGAACTPRGPRSSIRASPSAGAGRPGFSCESRVYATPRTVAPRLLCPWILQAGILEWVAMPSSR